MIWSHLSRDDVGEWIESRLQGFAVPIWALSESTPDLLLDHPGLVSFASSHPRKDSGVWELVTRGSEHLVHGTISERLRQVIEEAARQIDQGRNYVREEPPRSEVILAEYSSVLRDPTIPVVGPGGHLTVYRTSFHGETNLLQIDLVIRPTRNPIPSRWRSASEIFRQWETRYSEEQEPLKISAAFGYFELSKYERQVWLRPAFVFDVGHPGTENTVAWQESFVLAATRSSEISLNEGLGSWGQERRE
jgi:hypothetical protein